MKLNIVNNSQSILHINNLLTDLQSYYRMDGSLGYAKDYSPYGRDASIIGQIYQDASGIVNTGFRWDSSTTTATYLRTPAFSLGESQLSFNVWVNPSTNTKLNTIIGDAQQSSTLGYVWIYQNAGNHLYFQYANGITPVTYVIANFFTGYFNTWTMITFTIDYANKIINIYRNNILVLQTYITTSMLFPSTSRVKYIGNYTTNNNYGWNSNIDEFGIWSRILSSDEVTQLYNAGAGRSHPFIGAINSGPSLQLIN